MLAESFPLDLEPRLQAWAASFLAATVLSALLDRFVLVLALPIVAASFPRA
jgi:hypothetical protein